MFILITCSHIGESITKKFNQLVNTRQRTGNPNIFQVKLKAKNNNEVINTKAGVTEANVSEILSA